MIECLIFCGLPGAGKSSTIKNFRQKYNAVIVSRDSLREMVAGSYDVYQENVFAPDKVGTPDARIMESLVLRMAEATVMAAIEAGMNIIIDETNISKKMRRHWVDVCVAAHDYYSSEQLKFTCVWIKCSPQSCIKRRLKDSHGCKADWPKVISYMAKYWTDPLKEDFDELIIIDNEEDKKEGPQ